jgi:hypothetical protein
VANRKTHPPGAVLVSGAIANQLGHRSTLVI